MSVSSQRTNFVLDGGKEIESLLLVKDSHHITAQFQAFIILNKCSIQCNGYLEMLRNYSLSIGNETTLHIV